MTHPDGNTAMKRDINWKGVSFQLNEALWSLKELAEAVNATKQGERTPPFTEGRLAVELEHIMGHLCWAWNERRLPSPCQHDFLLSAMRKWPCEETFSNLWPRSAWRLMKGRPTRHT